MKLRLAVTFVAVLVVLIISLPAQAVKVGDMISIEGDRGDHPCGIGLPYYPSFEDDWDWVKIENPSEIGDHNHTRCKEVVLDNQGMVTAIKIEGSRVRCRYTTLLQGGGTCAWNGTEFYIPKSEFDRHLKVYQKFVRDNGGWAKENDRQEEVAAETADNLKREKNRWQVASTTYNPDAAVSATVNNSPSLALPHPVSATSASPETCTPVVVTGDTEKVSSLVTSSRPGKKVKVTIEAPRGTTVTITIQ